MSPVAAFHRAPEPLADELDEVFREHSRLVYRTAFSVTASAQDAEDIVQTLFLQLLRRGFPPDFRRNPKGYLYRSAINLALNVVRSRRRRESVVDAARRHAVTDSSATAGGSEHDSDLQKRLVAAIAQLNPRAVEMLVLRYEHDASEADIGRLLGTSRAVVAVTLFRARARLKKLLRTKDTP